MPSTSLVYRVFGFLKMLISCSFVKLFTSPSVEQAHGFVTDKELGNQLQECATGKELGKELPEWR